MALHFSITVRKKQSSRSLRGGLAYHLWRWPHLESIYHVNNSIACGQTSRVNPAKSLYITTSKDSNPVQIIKNYRSVPSHLLPPKPSQKEWCCSLCYKLRTELPPSSSHMGGPQAMEAHPPKPGHHRRFDNEGHRGVARFVVRWRRLGWLWLLPRRDRSRSRHSSMWSAPSEGSLRKALLIQLLTCSENLSFSSSWAQS